MKRTFQPHNRRRVNSRAHGRKKLTVSDENHGK